VRIAPPDDNIKVQRQNRPAKTRGAETRPMEELSETAPLPPIKENHEHLVHVRAEERRLQERRQHDENTTLDTRGPHSRRTQMRRKEEIEQQGDENSETPQRGVDVLA